MYTFIYFTLLVFKLWQKQFSQKMLQFCEGGTILKRNEEDQEVTGEFFVIWRDVLSQ